MAKAEASVNELVTMIEKGELRLPEMQRRYVWRSTRVRDLLDSLYRGWPSGAILVWETEEKVPLQDFAIAQTRSPYASKAPAARRTATPHITCGRHPRGAGHRSWSTNAYRDPLQSRASGFAGRRHGGQ